MSLFESLGVRCRSISPTFPTLPGNRPCEWSRLPISRRRLDAPYIAGLIQGQSDQPQLLILTNPDAVYYPRSDSGSGRKTLQLDRGANFQWTTEPRRASLGVHQDYQARLGKWISRIQISEGNRNLARNSSTGPDRPFVGKRTQLEV